MDTPPPATWDVPMSSILRCQPLTTRTHGAVTVYVPLRRPSRSSANLLPWLITALCLTWIPAEACQDRLEGRPMCLSCLDTESVWQSHRLRRDKGFRRHKSAPKFLQCFPSYLV
jgi:hypothetical protein